MFGGLFKKKKNKKASNAAALDADENTNVPAPVTRQSKSKLSKVTKSTKKKKNEKPTKQNRKKAAQSSVKQQKAKLSSDSLGLLIDEENTGGVALRIVNKGRKPKPPKVVRTTTQRKVGNVKREKNSFYPGDVDFRAFTPRENWMPCLGRSDQVVDLGDVTRVIRDSTDY